MYDENYLAHYGILGQKWGVRRFQPYSVRGRKSGESGKEVGEAKKRAKAPSHEALTRSTNAEELYRYRDQLSDRELQDRLNRLRNEEALKQMAKNRKQGKSVGKQVLQKIGEKSAEAIAVAVVGSTIGMLARKGGESVSAIMKEYGPELVQMAKGTWEILPKK